MSKLVSILVYAAAASAVAIRNIDCTPGPITTNGRSCTVECGADHAGGDYASQYTADFASCIDACTADETCETAQYLTTNSYCYLKNSVNSGSDNSLVNSILCPASDSSSPPPPSPAPPPPAESCTPGRITVNGRVGNIECGSDHPGGDYASQWAGSLEVCESVCAVDAKCLTAQYDHDTRYCYLKDSVTASVVKANVDGIVFLASAPYSNSTTNATSLFA